MRPVYRWLAYAIAGLMLAGCITVKLVGDYDEQIDKGITALQKDLEAFLVKLESSAPRPKDKVEDYARHRQFYADAKVAISSLRVRADATERNSLTVRMLDRLRSNLERFEDMHREGMVGAEIEPLRGGFNTQFTAILTFELAKKRGEKPDEGKAGAASTPASTKGGSK